MNVDILSFVIIITVDYIQELRSGGQTPSSIRDDVGESCDYIIIGKRKRVSGSWSAKLLSYLFKELNKHDVRILCDFFSLWPVYPYLCLSLCVCVCVFLAFLLDNLSEDSGCDVSIAFSIAGH